MHAQTVQIAAPTAAAQLIDTLVLAFGADPVARWVYPDPAQYLTHFRRFIQAFGGKAFDQSTAFTLDGRAAALWLAPGVQPDEAELMASLTAGLPAADQPPVFRLFAQMDAFHPGEPHWHLPLLGVDPAHQGRGRGTRLLRAILDRCDQDGTPAYLEATSAQSVALYQRHGFVALGLIQVDDSPPLTPMLRRPLAPVEARAKRRDALAEPG